MNIDKVFEWILSHPLNYPGKHQESQPRTTPSYKPLEPKAQLHIIFRATGEYIKEKMLEGKGINMRNFGAFTFEVFSDTVKPAQFSGFDVTKDLDQQRKDRKHVHKIRPCFIPDKNFKYTLARYPGKDEITAPKSQHSIYQKGFGMMFCNPGPIAASCYLSNDVVSSAHQSLIQSICDLTQLGHQVTIDWGFLSIKINNKDLKYQYKADFIQQLNQTNFEDRMRRSDQPTPAHWTTTYQDKWAKSSLNSLLKRPNTNQVQDFYEKTLALKIMSLDLSTAEQTKYSSLKKAPQQLLPGIKKTN